KIKRFAACIRLFILLLQKFKDLDPLVECIAYIHSVIIDEHPVRQPELTLVISPAAECQKKLTPLIKKLHIVKKRIDDIDSTMLIHGNAFWHRKIPGPISMMAKGSLEISRFIKYLNSEVHGIRNIKESYRRPEDMSGEIKPAGFFPPFTE